MEMDSSGNVKKRQRWMAGGAVAAVVGLVVGGLWYSDPNRQVDAAAKVAEAGATKISYTTPAAASNPEDVWITRSEAQLAAMQKQNEALAAQMSKLTESLKDGTALVGAAAPGVKPAPADDFHGMPDGLSVPDGALQHPDHAPPATGAGANTNTNTDGKGKPEAAGGSLGELPPAPDGKTPDGLPAPPPPIPGGVPIPPPAPAMGAPKPGGQPGEVKAPGILSIDLGANWKDGKDLGAGGKDGAPAPDGTPKTSHTANNYLPAGSFVKAVLLSGLDAPTGGQAQTNPQPILLQLVDDGTLPNKFTSRIRSCHMTAAGYGDISSERAYLRLERMSCVMGDGRVVDSPVKGFVSGEDGKAGMRGTLVSKQGQMLAKALVSGVAGGIGTGISQAASTISTAPATGAVTTAIDPSKIMQAGVGSGFGKTLEKVADWYLQRANETYPVIEVSSGRTVDIVLNEGFEFGDGVDIQKDVGDGGDRDE